MPVFPACRFIGLPDLVQLRVASALRRRLTRCLGGSCPAPMAAWRELLALLNPEIRRHPVTRAFTAGRQEQELATLARHYLLVPPGPATNQPLAANEELLEEEWLALSLQARSTGLRL